MRACASNSVMAGRTLCVYMLSNTARMLYVGVTNDIERRVWQHKHKCVLGFTSNYNLGKLVYYEFHGNARSAIAREKQIKGWLRSKKVALVTSLNPTWQDLSEGWFSKFDPHAPVKAAFPARHKKPVSS